MRAGRDAHHRAVCRMEGARFRRYLWEIGARIKTEGPTFTVTTTVPIPSIKIPAR